MRLSLKRHRGSSLLIAAAVVTVGATLAGVMAFRGDDPEGGPPDYSARFEGFEAAPEPNVDATTVDWPSFVLKAGPEVKGLYVFVLENGDLMRYMPCFCGCGGTAGHRSNRDCFVRRVNADGSVVFDEMAPT